MKREEDNLSYSNSDSTLDENISRLVKLADGSNRPGRTFTESLMNNVLSKLEKLKVSERQEIIYVSRREQAVGWAAMVAAGCGAMLAFVASMLLKINFFLEAAAVLTVSYNWMIYLGEHAL